MESQTMAAEIIVSDREKMSEEWKEPGMTSTGAAP
jgi:hypothetical protein